MMKKKFLIPVLMMAAMFLIAGCGSKEQMVLSFINIGKGDAFLIRVPGGGYYMCEMCIRDRAMTNRAFWEKAVWRNYSRTG